MHLRGRILLAPVFRDRKPWSDRRALRHARPQPHSSSIARGLASSTLFEVVALPPPCTMPVVSIGIPALPTHAAADGPQGLLPMILVSGSASRFAKTIPRPRNVMCDSCFCCMQPSDRRFLSRMCLQTAYLSRAGEDGQMNCNCKHFPEDYHIYCSVTIFFNLIEKCSNKALPLKMCPPMARE